MVSLRLHTFLVFNLAGNSNSPDRSTKSTQSEVSFLPLFVSTRFQVLFHSPPGVLFTFPSQYCFTIGHWGVFRLGGWSLRLPTGFLVSRGTLDTARWFSISPTGLSPSLVCFPKTFRLSIVNTKCGPQPQKINLLVWPLPISLAATFGIEFSFFSYCYLDVSVHSVPLHRLCIYLWIHEFSSCRFPHSDIPGSMAICASPRLFAAYHVLRRLSVPRHSPCALFRLT